MISPKQISYQKLHSQVQLIYCWIYETSSQRRSCEAELYFSMKQQRMRLAEGLHRKTESDKLQPYCSAFTMFYLCQAPHVQTSFSSKKKKRERREGNKPLKARGLRSPAVRTNEKYIRVVGQEILTLDIRGLIVSNHVGSICVAGILPILEMPSNSAPGTVK